MSVDPRSAASGDLGDPADLEGPPDLVAASGSGGDPVVDVGPGVRAGINLFPFLQAEERHRDQQATDAVALTYNVDLGFVEARLLGVLRAAGACLTIVADGHVWAPDARAVTRAGRDYQVAITATRAAFHPKVFLLVGPKRALLAVGSGNLTLGGWQYNEELLTVATADHRGVPELFGDVLDLLDHLGERPADTADPDTADADTDGVAGGEGERRVRLDEVSAAGIRRAASTLRRFVQDYPAMQTGHRLVSSHTEKIINALPRGPVDELLLTAAFHDPRAAAVRALLDRLEPARVKVAVQPGWTSLTPAALEGVLTSWAAAEPGRSWDLVRDPENPGQDGGRYRHGKLIEWATGSQRMALTGSANLSAAALLNSTAEGGNYEVGVIGPVEGVPTLFPGSTPLAFDEVPDAVEVRDPDTHTETAPVALVAALSAATLTPAGFRVQFAAPTGHGARVEVSGLRQRPELWDVVAPVPPGVTHLDLTIAPDSGFLAGSRVRVTWPDPGAPVAPDTQPPQADSADRAVAADRERVAGQVRFLTDPVAVQTSPPMRGRSASRTSRASVNDLLGDDLTLLIEFEKDFVTLAAEKAAMTPATHTSGDGVEPVERVASRLGSTAVHGDEDGAGTWLWEQTQSRRALGSAITGFAWGLPSGMELGPLSDVSDIPWAEKPTRGLDEPDLDVVERSEVTVADVDAEVPGGEEIEIEAEAGAVPERDHRRDPERLRKGRREQVRRWTETAHLFTITSRMFYLRLALILWSKGNWDEGDEEPLVLVESLVRAVSGAQIQEQAFSPTTDEQILTRMGSLVAVALGTVRAHLDPTDPGSALTRRYRSALLDTADVIAHRDGDVVTQYLERLINRHGYPITPDDVTAVADDMAVTNRPLADAIDVAEALGRTATILDPSLLLISKFKGSPEAVALQALANAQDSPGMGAWAVNEREQWALVVWSEPDLVTVIGGKGPTRWRHQVLPASARLAAVVSAGLSGDAPRHVRVATPRHAPTPQAREVLERACGITDVAPPPVS